MSFKNWVFKNILQIGVILITLVFGIWAVSLSKQANEISANAEKQDEMLNALVKNQDKLTTIIEEVKDLVVEAIDRNTLLEEQIGKSKELVGLTTKSIKNADQERRKIAMPRLSVSCNTIAFLGDLDNNYVTCDCTVNNSGGVLTNLTIREFEQPDEDKLITGRITSKNIGIQVSSTCFGNHS